MPTAPAPLVACLHKSDFRDLVLKFAGAWAALAAHRASGASKEHFTACAGGVAEARSWLWFGRSLGLQKLLAGQIELVRRGEQGGAGVATMMSLLFGSLCFFFDNLFLMAKYKILPLGDHAVLKARAYKFYWAMMGSGMISSAIKLSKSATTEGALDLVKFASEFSSVHIMIGMSPALPTPAWVARPLMMLAAALAMRQQLRLEAAAARPK